MSVQRHNRVYQYNLNPCAPTHILIGGDPRTQTSELPQALRPPVSHLHTLSCCLNLLLHPSRNFQPASTEAVWEQRGARYHMSHANQRVSCDSMW